MRPARPQLSLHRHVRCSPLGSSWGTKVTAIVEQVQALPATDKCLIFSQWDDMLSLIGRALSENQIDFRRLQGVAKLDAALHGFRQDVNVRALLLPLKV